MLNNAITSESDSTDTNIVSLNDKRNVISMSGICKEFPGIKALDNVTLDLREGEIHGLLGENGAGKTTLMNILSGRYRLDEGIINIRGKEVSIRSPRDSIALKIGMVHQNFLLIPELTVAENIVLGDTNIPFLCDEKVLASEVTDLMDTLAFGIDEREKIWRLSIGEQQQVEIIKLFYRGANILILDEPTSILTTQQTGKLFGFLKNSAQKGNSFLFISHKLDEILSIADRITVLRKGKNVGTVEAKNTNKQELAHMMVGRDIFLDKKLSKVELGEPVLKVKNLSALDDRRHPCLKNITFNIREGEIFGLAGVGGNGQTELSEVIVGLRRATEGEIWIKQKQVLGFSVQKIKNEGVAFIPQIALGLGLVPDFNAPENLILTTYKEPRFSRNGWLKDKEIVNYSKDIIETFSIDMPSETSPARLLSGGNAQKMVLGREMSGNPKVLVAVYPIRGLDVGAVEFVHKILQEQKERGTAILLISEDLEEIITLSDTIGVIYKGTIVDVMSSEDANIETIGLLMATGK